MDDVGWQRSRDRRFHIVRLRLSNTQMAHMTKRQTPNPEAYQLYLKGRYFAAQFTPEGFRQAIALDPTYALAYDGMSYYYTLIEDQADVPAEVMPKSEEAARKAIELDDSLVQPHVEQAFNYTLYDFDWPPRSASSNVRSALTPTMARRTKYTVGTRFRRGTARRPFKKRGEAWNSIPTIRLDTTFWVRSTRNRAGSTKRSPRSEKPRSCSEAASRGR